MNKDEMKPTGCYVICNFGLDKSRKTAPAYLCDPLRGGTPHYYTTNICKADMFAYRSAAEAQMKNENEHLKAEGHPLAGHLFVAEMFTCPIVEPPTDL